MESTVLPHEESVVGGCFQNRSSPYTLAKPFKVSDRIFQRFFLKNLDVTPKSCRM